MKRVGGMVPLAKGLLACGLAGLFVLPAGCATLLGKDDRREAVVAAASAEPPPELLEAVAYHEVSGASAAPDDRPAYDEARRPEILFATDEAGLDEADVGQLAGWVHLLRAEPSVRLQLRGHADERGTYEYNLLLSERRARAVRDHLVRQGVGPARIEVLGFGEEMPNDLGHDEQAWSRNRRVEIVILR